MKENHTYIRLAIRPCYGTKMIFIWGEKSHLSEISRVSEIPAEWCTVKPLNSGHLRILRNLSVIKRCSLLGRILTKIVTFRTKHFVRYSRHVRYMGCPLLGGFTVFNFLKANRLCENGFIPPRCDLTST